MHYLSSCQCFSQSEFRPSPEGNAINVWSVLLGAKGFWKCWYHRGWVQDPGAAPGVLNTWPALGPCLGSHQSRQLLLAPKGWETPPGGTADVSLTLGQPLAQPPTKGCFSLCSEFGYKTHRPPAATMVNVQVNFSSSWAAEFLGAFPECPTESILLLQWLLCQLLLPGQGEHGLELLSVKQCH